MPYRDDLVAAVARADAAEKALADERAHHAADRDLVERLRRELREASHPAGRTSASLLLLMLGMEFLAVVALAIGYLGTR